MSNVPMTRPEDMLAEHESTELPLATLVELQDGRILSASSTHFSVSEDGGVTWSEPFQRRDPNGDIVGGGCMVRLSGNAVGITRVIQPEGAMYRWQSVQESRLMFWRSDDGGETWERPVRITPEGAGAIPLHDTMFRTSSGRIVIPVYISQGQNDNQGFSSALGDYGGSGKLLNGQWVATSAHYFDPGASCSFAYYSDDEGRTWQRNKNGNLFVQLDWNATLSYTNEPSATEVEPGKLLMILRTGLGRLYQAWSQDNGTTWGRPQPTSLASSTAPAQIRKLPNGHLLAVWNQQSEEDVKRGYFRTRLSSAISRNGGSVWEFFQNVESIQEKTRVEPGPIRRGGPAEYHHGPGKPAPEREAEHVTPATELGTWTYPGVLVTQDRVLISYRCARFDEHPVRAQLVNRHFEKLKVLPLTWLYGGKEPADNPMLP